MSLLRDTLQELRQSGRKAFIPFITAGDPDLDFTRDAIVSLALAGAAVIEVGIPYSDPIADGPVIQQSYGRALLRGVTVSKIMAMLADLRPRIDVPIVIMVSQAIVHRRGPVKVVQEAVAAGVDGAIIPDLPWDESRDLFELSQQSGLGLCQLVTPTTSEARVRCIVAQTSGFVYCVSLTGITGERSDVPDDLAHRVRFLRECTDLPVCVGFGIRDAAQARTVASIADGVIIGSALVRRIAESQGESRDSVLRDVRTWATSMVAAVNAAR